jgi:hypothetical protein
MGFVPFFHFSGVLAFEEDAADTCYAFHVGCWFANIKQKLSLHLRLPHFYAFLKFISVFFSKHFNQFSQ